MAQKLSESIAIDDERGILDAFGQKMSAEFLKAFSEPTPDGVWFRIFKDEHGVLRIESNIGHERNGETLQ